MTPPQAAVAALAKQLTEDPRVEDAEGLASHVVNNALCATAGLDDPCSTDVRQALVDTLTNLSRFGLGFPPDRVAVLANVAVVAMERARMEGGRG